MQGNDLARLQMLFNDALRGLLKPATSYFDENGKLIGGYSDEEIENFLTKEYINYHHLEDVFENSLPSLVLRLRCEWPMTHELVDTAYNWAREAFLREKHERRLTNARSSSISSPSNNTAKSPKNPIPKHAGGRPEVKSVHERREVLWAELGKFEHKKEAAKRIRD